MACVRVAIILSGPRRNFGREDDDWNDIYYGGIMGVTTYFTIRTYLTSETFVSLAPHAHTHKKEKRHVVHVMVGRKVHRRTKVVVAQAGRRSQ